MDDRIIEKFWATFTDPLSANKQEALEALFGGRIRSGGHEPRSGRVSRRGYLGLVLSLFVAKYYYVNHNHVCSVAGLGNKWITVASLGL